MRVIFTFTVDTESGDAVVAGNVPVADAAQILSQLATADAIRRALDAQKDGNKKEVKKDAIAGLPKQSES